MYSRVVVVKKVQVRNRSVVKIAGTMFWNLTMIHNRRLWATLTSQKGVVASSSHHIPSKDDPSLIENALHGAREARFSEMEHTWMRFTHLIYALVLNNILSHTKRCIL